jgi:hypothetical protein
VTPEHAWQLFNKQVGIAPTGHSMLKWLTYLLPSEQCCLVDWIQPYGFGERLICHNPGQGLGALETHALNNIRKLVAATSITPCTQQDNGHYSA